MTLQELAGLTLTEDKFETFRSFIENITNTIVVFLEIFSILTIPILLIK